MFLPKSSITLTVQHQKHNDFVSDSYGIASCESHELICSLVLSDIWQNYFVYNALIIYIFDFNMILIIEILEDLYIDLITLDLNPILI